MSSEIRMTQALRLVLQVLLVRPTHEMYGLQICEAAGLPSGTIHPILARLEKLEWLESRWEDVDPSLSGRPRRRYYKLSPDGAEKATAALAAAQNRRAGWMSRPVAGEVTA
ncbi:PadR family transcriptional regulator [Krasilnikovia sp. MM14-A1259]|uniref:PadR family transcriptional regulator n=1 Tax=Krasilnikovia sp. MM14-A1259 TaxID=3373539 RepID=UPI00382F5288